jgi:hypothetical protein
MERRGRKGSSCARSEEMERAGDIEKNGGIFFDRPKSTAGCSASGRRRRPTHAWVGHYVLFLYTTLLFIIFSIFPTHLIVLGLITQITFCDTFIKFQTMFCCQLMNTFTEAGCDICKGKTHVLKCMRSWGSDGSEWELLECDTKQFCR